MTSANMSGFTYFLLNGKLADYANNVEDKTWKEYLFALEICRKV